MVLGEHVDQADHAVHRRADLVAHGGEEGRLGAAGLFGILTRLGQTGDQYLTLADAAQRANEEVLTMHVVFGDADFQIDCVSIPVPTSYLPGEACDVPLTALLKACDGMSDAIVMIFTQLGRHQHGNVATDQFGRCIAEQRLDARIDALHDATAVDGDHALEQMVEHGTDLFFLGLQVG
ncbi:hypothetical protein D3C78_536300 [compost metagenome]